MDDMLNKVNTAIEIMKQDNNQKSEVQTDRGKGSIDPQKWSSKPKEKISVTSWKPTILVISLLGVVGVFYWYCCFYKAISI